MKKIYKIIASLFIFFSFFSIALAAINIVPNGGTGVGTITGIIKGSGTSPFSAAISGTDYLPITGGTGITTLGTITTGVWQGNPIGTTYGGTGGSSPSITLFNNITGYTASGATGTTSTNLVFSTSPTLVTPNIGSATASGLTLSGITGSTQCLHVNSSGVVSGTASDCGAGGGGLTVGTTTITSGTNTRIEFNNSGVLGEYTISGSGNVAMTTSPTFVTPVLGTPTSGVGTNITGITAAHVLAGTLGTGAYTMDTSLTNPLLIGGTAVGSSLSLKSTSGVGTTDFIKFLVGNNGATEAARILHSGQVVIGDTAPTSNLANAKLVVTANTVYNDNHGAFAVTSATNNALALYMGYDQTNSFAYLQSVIEGSTYASLILNPAGGNVSIGYSTGSVPNAVLQLDGADSNTAYGAANILWLGDAQNTLNNKQTIGFGIHTASVVVPTNVFGTSIVTLDGTGPFLSYDFVWATRLASETYGTTPTERMRLTSPGNLQLLTGTISKYNGIATVSNGVPSELGTADLAAQSAAKTATTLYTPTASGMYRISIVLQVTRASDISSILGGTTGVVITYTEPDGSVAQSIVPALDSQTGALIVPANGNTGNATTTQSQGTAIIYAKSGTAIQYAIGYSSTQTTTSMQYAAHLKAEAL